MKRIIGASALALTIVGGLVSCDAYKESQGTSDAPIARTEKDGWVVLASPDQFPNVAFRCMGVNGIYNPRLASKDAAREITVVVNDPQCKKG